MFTVGCKYPYRRPESKSCKLSVLAKEGCMVGRTVDRTNYLSLALDARKTVKALMQLSKGVETTSLKEALEDTVESLRALKQGSSLSARLHPKSSFEYYEQIRTLQEVQSSMNDENLADKLSALNAEIDPNTQKQFLKIAITFFSALENRALQRYNRSAGSAFGS